MNTFSRRPLVWSLLAALCLAPATLRAATPTEELLRFVPEDVSFCLVVRDLRGHAQALADSPFARKLRRSPLGDVLRTSQQAQPIAAVEEYLKKHLGMTLDQLRDDILGEAVVLAYRAGPPGKPKEEQGLLLIRSRDPKKLADLIDRLNRLQKESGDLKDIEPREHDGLRYFRRIEKKETNYYHVRGPVLVFSGQEAMLRRALTLEKKTPADRPSAVGERMRRLGADKALLSLWVNPRAFDAELAAKVEQAQGDEAAFLKTFQACWKALEGIALTLKVGKDIEAGLTVRADPKALPAAVRRFFDEAAKPSGLWTRFPDDALFAAAARTSAPALLEMLGAFQTKEAFDKLKADLNRGLWATLGKNVVKDVLPHVGPDWGLCVSPPSSTDKAWLPLTVFAVRVRPGDKNAPLDRGLLSALHIYAGLAALGHNQKLNDPARLLRLRTVEYGKVEVHYLASPKGAAVGLQPAFGLCGGYLVLGSSPEAIRRFAAATPAPMPTGEIPLLRLSIKNLRQYLKERRQPLTSALAKQHGVEAKEIDRRLDSLLAGLELFDRVELTQRTSSGQVTLTLRLRPAQPLRK